MVADCARIKPFVTTSYVTNDTFISVAGEKLVRSLAELSWHRVAGAPSLGWAPGRCPDVPAFADGVARAIEPRGEGEVVVLEAVGRAGRSSLHPDVTTGS